MRTTLSLDEDLMRRVKKQAAETGRTISSMVESALRDLLRRETRRAKPRPFRWVTVRGELQPGVDLSDRDSLIDRMEERL